MRSLQATLSAGLLISLVVGFVVLWLVVSSAIRYVAEDYVTTRIRHDSETLLAALDFGPSAVPQLDTARLDAIYRRPFSGHYYKILSSDARIRSRSLWDQDLAVPALAAGESVRLRLDGPQNQPLLVLVSGYRKQSHGVTVALAEDVSRLEADLAALQRRFALTAGLLLMLLIAAQALMVRLGLRPLERARGEVRALAHGDRRQLSDAVPTEMQPLVNEVNHLLHLLDARLQRQRNALGDLAHALKKPLTVLRQAEADEALDGAPAIRQTIQSQTRAMQQSIDRVLRRARLAGEGPPGAYFRADDDVPPLIDALRGIHHGRDLLFETDVPEGLVVAVDREDMLELLGNLLDNACKHARRAVRLSMRDGGDISVVVDDDGPGVSDGSVSGLAQRGLRLDETTEGHGLGLAIVRDIVEQYGGTLRFDRSEQLGGLRVSITIAITGVDAHTRNRPGSSS